MCANLVRGSSEGRKEGRKADVFDAKGLARVCQTLCQCGLGPVCAFISPVLVMSVTDWLACTARYPNRDTLTSPCAHNKVGKELPASFFGRHSLRSIDVWQSKKRMA
jgi:hypothetical protein